MYATLNIQKVFKTIIIWLSCTGVKFRSMMLKMR
jgi:hypothetical protein